MSHQLDDYRLLGRSGLRVSPLSLGAMTFAMKQAWGAEDAEAEKIFNHYVERGGNFIDTANFYASGGSEQVVGKLAKSRRERLVIATKYSLTMRPGDPNAAGNHRKNMVRSVEDSLRRLDTDYIDLLYLHVWDRRTPVEEILRAFDDLVRAGKVVYVGLSDTPAWQASRMQAIADLRGWAPLIALQILYNVAQRDAERDLLPMALEMGMGVLPWSPLAGGVLSGKYSRKDLDVPSSDKIADINNRQKMNVVSGRLTERTLDIADVVKAVAQEIGRTPSQVALAWTLLHPAVVSPIMGARTLDQLKDNLDALELSLSADQIQRIDEASQIALGFPHDMISGAMSVQMFGGVKVALPPGR